MDLLLPRIIQKIKEVREFFAFLKFWKCSELKFETEFDTKWLGRVKYKYYVI